MSTSQDALVEVKDDAGRGEAVTVLLRPWSKPAAVICVGIILLIAFCALFPSLLAPHDPYAQSLARRLKPPSFMEGGIPGFWPGTDHLGRDTLSRIIYGARVTLIVSVCAVVVSGRSTP